MLTPTERAEMNRMNALCSTGPKTEEGKAKSSQNARKHGLTVSDLTLCNENPEVIQASAAAWSEALEPEGMEQEALVNKIAIEMVKRDRFNKAETAIVDEQIRKAVGKWDKANHRDFLDAKSTFIYRPDRGLVDLQRNGQGLAWLITQWEVIKQAFEAFHCLNSLALIKEAIQLSGYQPNSLRSEDMRAYDFAMMAVCCNPGEYAPNDMREYILGDVSPQFHGCHGSQFCYPREVSQAFVRDWIETQLTTLKALQEPLKARETASRAGAEARAMVLKDSLDNRLLYRYARANDSSLEKALKRLEKLKEDRKKEVEAELKKAAEAEEQNEAMIKGMSTTSKVRVGSYINIGKQRFEVVETGDGGVYMVECIWVPAGILATHQMSNREAVSTPISGV